MDRFVNTSYGKAKIVTSKYRGNDALAVMLVLEDGEPLATLSVNLEDSGKLKEDEFFLKDWSENGLIAEAVMDSGWVEYASPYQAVVVGYGLVAEAFKLRDVQGEPLLA